MNAKEYWNEHSGNKVGYSHFLNKCASGIPRTEAILRKDLSVTYKEVTYKNKISLLRKYNISWNTYQRYKNKVNNIDDLMRKLLPFAKVPQYVKPNIDFLSSTLPVTSFVMKYKLY